MRKHPTENPLPGNILYFRNHEEIYAIPIKIARTYRVDTPIELSKTELENKSAEVITAPLDKKYTRAGALLKGVRAREDMGQLKFAEAIGVTQSNLSKMENGKRAIGKKIAKRIEKAFDVDYRYFLE
jgi:DNA-binding XRE family transcriptional regulator